MTTDKTPAFEHPLRSRNDIPRSDIRHVVEGLASALDAMLATHAPAAGGKDGSVEIDTPQKKQVVTELMRCLGTSTGVTGLAVGDVIVQIVCENEAGAAAVTAVLNHTGLAGKASWFKGSDETNWIVLVVPKR